MSTYLVPICEGGDAHIMSCNAHSLKHAEDNFTRQLADIYSGVNIDSWEDLLNDLYESGIVVGEIYDIEELQC